MMLPWFCIERRRLNPTDLWLLLLLTGGVVVCGGGVVLFLSCRVLLFLLCVCVCDLFLL